MAEKKKFMDVQAPLLNKNIEVLGTPAELKNKTIKLDLTRKLKGKGLNVTFQIIDSNNNLFAVPKKMELNSSYIRKIMRKRVDYVEDSFITNCKDVSIIIKPFLITRKKVSRAVRRKLREVTKEFLIEYVKEKNYVDVCQDLFNSQLQKQMLPKLKKVYPLAFCDLRILETKKINELTFLGLEVNEDEDDEGEDYIKIKDEDDEGEE
ncbi:MAG: hypothetical protein PHX15_00460 [Candidatus Nanoarchaeia archaeon]|jgi:ribosomal protein S3AE|nr:hypothetical protein [Candidatus Nanoarchaeia archaeon]MDD3993656.1 hypothetical protein [Candidatus Nanoarchaeia archaeon]MDD4563605.1 hypothetical protein [Candidatus Nanoarchaeia archaeon]